MGVPIAARGLSIAGALATGFLLAQRLTETLPDRPVVAGGFLLAALPFLALLTWIGVAPEHARRRLNDLASVDLAEPREIVGFGIHLVFAWLVFGGTVLQTASLLSQFVRSGEHPALQQQLGSTGIVVNLLASMLLFVVAAVTWLWLVDRLDLSGIVEELRLELSDLPGGVVYGIVATVAVFVVLAGLGLILQQLGVSPSNPQADAIASALSPWSAVAVAVLAGLGEEFYFRGFLLERTGNLAQASLFALLHATYLNAFQILLPFALGLAFGWLVRKTSLWAAIVAHASFNATMLLVQIYARDSGLALSLTLPF